jgi:hypothetical protein
MEETSIALLLTPSIYRYRKRKVYALLRNQGFKTIWIPIPLLEEYKFLKNTTKHKYLWHIRFLTLKQHDWGIEVTSWKKIKDFRLIRIDEKKYACAVSLLEILEKYQLAPIEPRHVFDLFYIILSNLESTPDTNLSSFWFQNVLLLLKFGGLQPRLKSCWVTNKKIDPLHYNKPIWWSPSLGSIVTQQVPQEVCLPIQPIELYALQQSEQGKNPPVPYRVWESCFPLILKHLEFQLNIQISLSNIDKIISNPR